MCCRLHVSQTNDNEWSLYLLPIVPNSVLNFGFEVVGSDCKVKVILYSDVVTPQKQVYLIAPDGTRFEPTSIKTRT